MCNVTTQRKSFTGKPLSTLPAQNIEISIPNLSMKYLGFLAGYNNINTQKVINNSIQDFMSFLNLGGSEGGMNQDTVNLYLNHLRKRELRNSSYNLKVSNLKKYLEYMGIRGLKYKSSKVEAYEHMDIISENHFKSIVRYLSNMKNIPGKKSTKYQRDYILYNLFFMTGIRKAEALSLKHSDIRAEGEGLVYFVRCKGGKEIKKPFPQSLFDQIQDLKNKESKQKDDFIFTGGYGGKKLKLSHFSVNKKLNSYHHLVNEKTETVTVHGIRNLSAWRVWTITKDILKVKEHLNHFNLNTTYKYLAKIESKKIDYYEEMEKVLA
jgi:site-specific recombinase XerD